METTITTTTELVVGKLYEITHQALLDDAYKEGVAVDMKMVFMYLGIRPQREPYTNEQRINEPFPHMILLEDKVFHIDRDLHMLCKRLEQLS